MHNAFTHFRPLTCQLPAESAFHVAMSSDCSSLEDIAGKWKVIDIPSEENTPDQDEDKASKELTGLVLVVESQGEVTWEVPPGAPDGLLLFDTNSAHFNKNNLTFLGGEQGWSLTFKVKGEPSKGWMVLESDSTEDCVGFSLSLAKEESITFDVINDHFTLKKAFDESFFSDIEFVCSDGMKVLAHRAILTAAYPTMHETHWLSLFQMQPQDMCNLLLSCIYSDSLPHTLKVERAKQLVLWLNEQPLMERMTLLVSAFIEANNLRQKMMSLIDELLVLLEDAKKTISNLTMTDSMKVMYTVKHLCKEAILGGAKICLLCQLYTKNKKEMSKSDKKQVLEYLRARVVMFMDLVKELALEAVEKWEALSESEQFELATYLIPHVEQAWDKFLKYATSLQVSLTQTLESRHIGMLSETQRGTRVSMILHLLSRGSERKRLQKIRKEFLESVEMAQGKRERWKRYSVDEKAGQIMNVVSKLVNEAEDLQVSMETRKKHLLENRLEWKAFRSYVDIVCMYMSWGLQKTLSLKDSLKHLFYEGLKFVGKTEVNEVAVYLGLFGEAELEAWLESIGWEQGTLCMSGTFPMSLPQVQPVVGPPLAATSVLAQGCVKLAVTQQYTDMEFVLGNTVIRAHRVIVASRCEWAYCALQSGMKEDREKRIVISDVEENVFRRFLNYLYGGPLGTATMETATLIDLMEVADRFDESRNLVRSCESLLSKRIEDSSVFELLKVAETFNTHALRESCMRYILQRPEVIIEIDGFRSLTEDIQQELRDLLSGTQDPTLLLRHSRPTIPHTIRVDDSSGASSEDDEELQLESNTIEWDIALESLRAVIGSEVTEDMLRELLLAADMDINRAINFFFK